MKFANFLRTPFSKKTFFLQITSNYSSVNNSGRKLASRIVNYDRQIKTYQFESEVGINVLTGMQV